MKRSFFLIVTGALLLATHAYADAPLPNAAAQNAPTVIPGTKGTLYGDLPVGIFSDDYENARPPTKVAPLPTHLMVKVGDGMSTLTDRSNPTGFSPREPLMSCIADGNQMQAARVVSAEGGGPRSIRSVRLVENEAGASLLSDSILLRNGMPAGAFHHGTLPLKKLEAVPGGLTVYGARDERPDHRYAYFIVKPPSNPSARIVNPFPAMLMSTDGRFQSVHGCGFVMVSLPLKKDAATTSMVRVTTTIAVNDIDPVKVDGEITLGAPQGGQRELVQRPVAIAFSASQLGGDTEPRLSVAAAWKGDEAIQRVFVPAANSHMK